MDWDANLIAMSTALGIGLLVGAVRERQHAEDRIGKAGVRTHALLALAGAIAASVGPTVLLVTLVAIALLTATSYRVSSMHDPGLTGEVAMLVTVLLGALAHEAHALAAALGVVVALLLWAKAPLRRLSRDLIGDREVQDGLLLAASALVVLPLLPDHPVDPWGVLQLSTLWKIVVLVMATGMLGHVAQRAVGVRRGLPVAGFFSGFASSTAAVASFGQLARAQPPLHAAAASAALLANLASLLLLAVVIAAISPALLQSVALPMIAGGVGLLLVAAVGLRRSDAAVALPAGTQSRAFRISHALAIALVIAAVMLFAEMLRRWVGETGAMIAATVAALAELHAAGATVAQLAASGGITPKEARWGVVALLAATSVAKSVLAFTGGGMAYARLVCSGLALMTAAAAAATWLLPA